MKHLLRHMGCSLLALGVTAGCASVAPETPTPNDPFFAPIAPELPTQKVSYDGSIFHAQTANSLYSDAKARRVGDIITVVLRENTQASKSASTNTARDTEMTVDPIIGLGGVAETINGQSVQLDLNTTNQFQADSTANQSNNLNGNISVTVIQVMPNNHLVVRGEKWLTLNNGDEYIRVTGIVRPADINPANEVLSTRLANARIQYSGTGTLAKSQNHGWLSKFFTSGFWPF